MAQRIPMKKKWLIAAVLFIVCALAATSCEKKDTDVVGTITPENVESGETVTSSFDYETSDLTPYVTLGNYEGLHGTLAKAIGHTLSEEEFQTRLVTLANAYGTTPDNMLAQYEESSLRKTLLWESLMAKIAECSEITETTTDPVVS